MDRLTRVARENFQDALVVLGLAAIIAGCFLIAVPIGLIAGGLVLVALGLLTLGGT